MSTIMYTLNPMVASDIREYCEANQTPLPETSDEAFEMWCTWNGLVGYAGTIRRVLFDCITSDPRYLTDTDADREQWLRDCFRL